MTRSFFHTAHRLAVVLGLFAAAAGCKSFSIPESADAVTPKQVLRVRWVKPLISDVPNFLIPELAEEHDRFNPVETASAGFDTDKKRAFIGVSTGSLYCLDIKSGKTVWRFDIKDPIGAEPIYDAERKAIFFGADDGKFYALHARSGRKLWEFETGAEVRRKAILHNGNIYIVNGDNTVIALDPDSGKNLWQYRRPPLKGFSAAGHAGLVLVKGKLVTGFSDGYIVALDPLVGAVIWSQDLAADVEAPENSDIVKLMDADATPAAVGNVVVSASVDGGLFGINADNGNILWTDSQISMVTGLAVKDDTVYAARSDFGLSAIKAETGEVLWSVQFPAGNLQDPVVYDDLLLLSDSMYGLTVLSTLDGSLLQRLNQTKGFFARPSLHAGYMFILGNGGTLFAMSIL